MTKYNKDNMNDIDEDGWTPLYSEIVSGDYNEVEKLLKIGANPNQLVDKEDLLTKAARKHRFKTITLLLKFGAKVELNNFSVLFYAMDHGSVALLKELLKYIPKGTNISVRDKYKYTPLLTGITEGHLEVVELLLPHITDLGRENSQKPNVRGVLRLNIKKYPKNAARWNKVLNILNGTMYGRRR